jgi:hypothetical protein
VGRVVATGFGRRRISSVRGNRSGLRIAAAHSLGRIAAERHAFDSTAIEIIQRLASILLPPVSAATLTGHYVDDVQRLTELRRYHAVQRGSAPLNAPVSTNGPQSPDQHEFEERQVTVRRCEQLTPAQRRSATLRAPRCSQSAPPPVDARVRRRRPNRMNHRAARPSQRPHYSRQSELTEVLRVTPGGVGAGAQTRRPCRLLMIGESYSNKTGKVVSIMRSACVFTDIPTPPEPRSRSYCTARGAPPPARPRSARQERALLCGWTVR